MKVNVSAAKKVEKKKASSSSFNIDTTALLNRFSDKHKEEFYREFSTLIKSGVDFNEALSILSEQQKSKFVGNICKEINASIVKGKTLFETIKGYKHFSPYEYYSIKIGEETKRLPEIFDQLAQFFNRKIKMKRQVISVLSYPVFVLLITIGVLYFMLNYVVPMFADVFKQFGKELPEITKFVVRISENFNVYAMVFFGVLIALFVAHRFFKDNERYKSMLSSIILKLPFFGKLIQKIYLARFCQSLSLLLSAKTPLIQALELTEKMIAFYPLKKAIGKARADVLKGESFSASIKKHAFFSPKIVSLTKIGEQINELDKMYDGLANQYNEDIDHSTKILGTILEPVMIVVIGSIVGFIMVAMYSPLFNLSKIIEN